MIRNEISKILIEGTSTKTISKTLLDFICKNDPDKSELNFKISSIPNPIKSKSQIEKLAKTASSYYSKAQQFSLLITGQYYLSKDNYHIIFSEHGHTCLVQSNGLYQGYKYIRNKFIYYGSFILRPSQTSEHKQGGFIYEGQGQMFQFPMKPGQKCFYYSGQWANDSISSGKKSTFTDQKQQSQYSGTFINMKYHGEGSLIDLLNNNAPKNGKFNYGTYEGKMK